jgi:hypothetical protein
LQERIETVGDDADLQEGYDTERHLLYVAYTLARRTRAEIAKPDTHGVWAHFVAGSKTSNGYVCVLEVESRYEGIGFKEAPWHENRGRKKISFHLHDLDTEGRHSGSEIHTEILIIMDLLAFVEEGMGQLMCNGKAPPGERMGAVHANDNAIAITHDQARYVIELHRTNDDSLTTNNIIDWYRGIGNTCFTEQPVGELLDA